MASACIAGAGRAGVCLAEPSTRRVGVRVRAVQLLCGTLSSPSGLPTKRITNKVFAQFEATGIEVLEQAGIKLDYAAEYKLICMPKAVGLLWMTPGVALDSAWQT